MSLTSYRAAPPRDTWCVVLFGNTNASVISGGDGVSLMDDKMNGFVLSYIRKLQCLATPYSSIA